MNSARFTISPCPLGTRAGGHHGGGGQVQLRGGGSDRGAGAVGLGQRTNREVGGLARHRDFTVGTLHSPRTFVVDTITLDPAAMRVRAPAGTRGSEPNAATVRGRGSELDAIPLRGSTLAPAFARVPGVSVAANGRASPRRAALGYPPSGRDGVAASAGARRGGYESSLGEGESAQRDVGSGRDAGNGTDVGSDYRGYPEQPTAASFSTPYSPSHRPRSAFHAASAVPYSDGRGEAGPWQGVQGVASTRPPPPPSASRLQRGEAWDGVAVGSIQTTGAHADVFRDRGTWDPRVSSEDAAAAAPAAARGGGPGEERGGPAALDSILDSIRGAGRRLDANGWQGRGQGVTVHKSNGEGVDARRALSNGVEVADGHDMGAVREERASLAPRAGSSGAARPFYRGHDDHDEPHFAGQQDGSGAGVPYRSAGQFSIVAGHRDGSGTGEASGHRSVQPTQANDDVAVRETDAPAARPSVESRASAQCVDQWGVPGQSREAAAREDPNPRPPYDAGPEYDRGNHREHRSTSEWEGHGERDGEVLRDGEGEREGDRHVWPQGQQGEPAGSGARVPGWEEGAYSGGGPDGYRGLWLGDQGAHPEDVVRGPARVEYGEWSRHPVGSLDRQRRGSWEEGGQVATGADGQVRSVPGAGRGVDASGRVGDEGAQGRDVHDGGEAIYVAAGGEAGRSVEGHGGSPHRWGGGERIERGDGSEGDGRGYRGRGKRDVMEPLGSHVEDARDADARRLRYPSQRGTPTAWSDPAQAIPHRPRWLAQGEEGREEPRGDDSGGRRGNGEGQREVLPPSNRFERLGTPEDAQRVLDEDAMGGLEDRRGWDGGSSHGRELSRVGDHHGRREGHGADMGTHADMGTDRGLRGGTEGGWEAVDKACQTSPKLLHSLLEASCRDASSSSQRQHDRQHLANVAGASGSYADTLAGTMLVQQGDWESLARLTLRLLSMVRKEENTAAPWCPTAVCQAQAECPVCAGNGAHDITTGSHMGFNKGRMGFNSGRAGGHGGVEVPTSGQEGKDVRANASTQLMNGDKALVKDSSQLPHGGRRHSVSAFGALADRTPRLPPSSNHTQVVHGQAMPMERAGTVFGPPGLDARLSAGGSGVVLPSAGSGREVAGPAASDPRESSTGAASGVDSVQGTDSKNLFPPTDSRREDKRTSGASGAQANGNAIHSAGMGGRDGHVPIPSGVLVAAQPSGGEPTEPSRDSQVSSRDREGVGDLARVGLVEPMAASSNRLRALEDAGLAAAAQGGGGRHAPSMEREVRARAALQGATVLGSAQVNHRRVEEGDDPDGTDSHARMTDTNARAVPTRAAGLVVAEGVAPAVVEIRSSAPEAPPAASAPRRSFDQVDSQGLRPPVSTLRPTRSLGPGDAAVVVELSSWKQGSVELKQGSGERKQGRPMEVGGNTVARRHSVHEDGSRRPLFAPGYPGGDGDGQGVPKMTITIAGGASHAGRRVDVAPHEGGKGLDRVIGDVERGGLASSGQPGQSGASGGGWHLLQLPAMRHCP
eukprot:jgi/Mesvir1/28456/Mv15879-RA.1